MNGYITLDKKILDWEWYKSHNEIIVFLHLLLVCNYESKTWRGIKIKRGQLVTSYQSLSNQTGLSIRSVRTAINNLQSTGELTSKPTNHFSIITICKYDTYQTKNKQTDTPTDKQTAKRNAKPTDTQKGTQTDTQTDNNLNKRSKENPAKLFKFLPVSWIEFENAVKYHSRNENSSELAFEIAYKFDDMNWTTSTGKKIDKNNYDSMVHNYIKKPELL